MDTSRAMRNSIKKVSLFQFLRIDPDV